MKNRFQLESPYEPSGDQQKAIDQLVKNLGETKNQVLLGATGTGKTFTIANVIAKTQRRTLVLAHNRTLANQLYWELKKFFPHNHVEYFVSYFDFFQPEAYLPATDTYIEKNAQSNAEIEMMRLSTLNSLSNYDDVIVVASVACIYPTASKVDFNRYRLFLAIHQKYELSYIKQALVTMDYTFNAVELKPGTFRWKGDVLEIMYGYDNEHFIRISFFGNEIEKITQVHALTGEVVQKLDRALITPANEYVLNRENAGDALTRIQKELEERITYFKNEHKLLEAERIEQRTNYDLESLREFGICPGIENYAAQLEGRGPGETPFSLLDFFNDADDEWLFVIDESHISVPQMRGMYNTDRSRKETLVEYGFRLPSALDNRPLTFDEIFSRTHHTIYVSATPNDWEKEISDHHIVEQIVRPTGLVDPTIEIRPSKFQIDDLINEIIKQRESGEKTFVSVITIKMAEELTDYLKQRGIKVAYLHNELKTIERSKVLYDLRKGKHEVVIGINLLREGIDIPEVSLMAIFDADKPGLFRSEKSLIQMIGRVARNVNGRVIMYADTTTKDMQEAIQETERRRNIQLAYNQAHHIVPKTIYKEVSNELFDNEDVSNLMKKNKSPTAIIKELKQAMLKAAKNQEYELAATLRDQIIELSAMVDNEKQR